MRAMRIKGEYLLKQKKYAGTKDLFIDVMKEREIPWAKIGLGKSLISLKEF